MPENVPLESGHRSQAMLLDGLMPDFDATRIEHRVIDCLPAQAYRAATEADLADAFRRSHVVRGLFALRAVGERMATLVASGAKSAPRPEVPAMRLVALPENGNWVRLGQNPPDEFAFGAIGRFWGAETLWAQIHSLAFKTFGDPNYAKIAASFSVRSYGDRRTVLSYEARTQATDEHARRAFLRYWTLVSPGVGVVMRSALAVIADEARERGR